MKWGLLGGAFDPIHLGHLRSGEEVREQLGLERILFAPSFVPPFKHRSAITPFEHRLRMVELAAASNPRFTVSDIERRDGLSYSIDTVRLLRGKYGQGLELYFIMGRDAFAGIQGWKDWEALLTSCNFAITTRPGSDSGDPGEFLNKSLPADFAARFAYDKVTDSFQGPSGHSLFFRTISCLAISSSDIRERLRQGRSVRYLVPDEVIGYIEEQGIYS